MPVRRTVINDSRRTNIPTADTTTLIIYAGAAVLALWLVFAMMRKLFGIAIIAAVVGAIWLLWTNPEVFEHFLGLFGASSAYR